MIRCRVAAILALSAGWVSMAAGVVQAGTEPGAVDTILRRPAEPGTGPTAPEGSFRLGPTRIAGDPATYLAEPPGAASPAGPDSAAPVRMAPASSAPSPGPAPRAQPDLVLPILGGIAGGTLGLYGGALAGLSLNEHDQGEWDEFGAFLTGAIVGEALLLPLGVHLGNGRRGSYANDLGIAVLAGLAGIGVLALTNGNAAGFVIGATLQLGCVVAQERSTARQRAGRRGDTGP